MENQQTAIKIPRTFEVRGIFIASSMVDDVFQFKLGIFWCKALISVSSRQHSQQIENLNVEPDERHEQ